MSSLASLTKRETEKPDGRRGKRPRKRVSGLTPKQSRLLYFIRAQIDASGVAPTFADMALALGIKSKSGIHRIVTGLEERGYVERNPRLYRSIQIIAMPNEAPHKPVTAQDLKEMVARLCVQEGPEVTIAALSDCAQQVTAMFLSTEGNA
jgi:SOS-response transcriptional repressor LexA